MKTIRIEKLGRLAVLRFDKQRANAIDPGLVEDLAEAVQVIGRDPAVRGVLMASSHPKIFCPGLDLVTLFGYDRPAMQGFMARFAAMLWALYDLRKPVVAAVNGAAVAGGCVLALTADRRVLRRGAPIGLNEVKIGLPLPWSVATLLRVTAAPGATARVALLGSNFTDEEAVAVGLADEVVEAEGFEATCLARLEELADRDPQAFATTKGYLRAGALAEMRAHEIARLGDFLDAWFSEATRERMRGMVEALTSKA